MEEINGRAAKRCIERGLENGWALLKWGGEHVERERGMVLGGLP